MNQTEQAIISMTFDASTLGSLDISASDGDGIRRDDERLIQQLLKALDSILLEMLSCRTKDEFAETRKRVWTNYFRSRRAASDTIVRLIPKNVIELTNFRASQGIMEDLDRFRGVLFDDRVAEQFEFSAWLITRIQQTASEIKKFAPPTDKTEDGKLNVDFHFHSAWGQLHYDCVLASMKFELPIAQGIQESIRDGLRAWVNSAALIEEALALRTGENVGGDVEFIDAPWDEEDDGLLKESMKDTEAQLSDDL